LSVPAGYLLDTNLISETRKLRADAGVMAFLAAADSAGSFLSVLTLRELRKGVEAKRRNDAATAARLDAWVDDIETIFAYRCCLWMSLRHGFGASCPPAAACR
jgi:toxin FitB